MLNDKLSEIASKKIDKNKRLGDIREAFVKTGIKQCMFDKEYRVDKRGKKTFTIRSHYKSSYHESDRNKERGIDFFS